MRDERRRACEVAAALLVEDGPQVVEAFARGQCHGVDATFAPRLQQACHIAVRLGPPIAIDVIDGSATRDERVTEQLAPYTATENNNALAFGVGKLGQFQQSLTVESRRWHAHVGDTDRHERGGCARAWSERQETWRPLGSFGNAVFDRVGAHEYGVVIPIELPL